MKYLRLQSNPVADPPVARGWVPRPLRTWFLACFILLCALISIAIEMILRACSPYGCQVLGEKSTPHVSYISAFVYIFLPAIAAVCFCLLWAVVHHHVLRMEPYFQMSRAHGAMAADSILLEYPYTFVLLVPFHALKRRHYIVLLSSCILLLITFFIAPLIAGLFDSKSLVHLHPDKANRGAIYSGDDPFSNFTAGFAYLAYGYWFLEASLPAFTTDTYALLPVNPKPGMVIENETWKFQTTLFSAELTCEEVLPLPIIHAQHGKLGEKFMEKDGNWTYAFWDWNALKDKSIVERKKMIEESVGTMSRNYPRDFVTPWTSIAGRLDRTSIYIWASSEDPSEDTSALPHDFTAISCLPSYYNQTVWATVTMPEGKVINVDRIGSRTEFQAENFTWAINGLEYTGFDGQPSEFGSIPRHLPNIDSKLRERLGPRPTDLDEWDPLSLQADGSKIRSTSVVGMDSVESISAFELNNQTIDSLDKLLDPKVLANEYQQTFQTLFAFAVSTEFVDNAAIEEIAINRGVPSRGFLVSHAWARGAQAGLAIVAIMTAVLAFFNRRRDCNLDGEPNSLAAALRLLALSPDVCKSLENAEFHSPVDLIAILAKGEKRYKLQLELGRSSEIVVDGKGKDSVGWRHPAEEDWHPWVGSGLWPLKGVSKLGLIIFLVLVTALLVALAKYSRSQDGIHSPGSSSSLTYKILFSYIPFAIGIAVELVLVTLGSLYCMLGPYKRLHHGHSCALKSLAVDYDNSPPHFQLLHAFRVRDIPLAALTTAILFANMLAVSFAGLFLPSTIGFDMDTDILTFKPPMIRQPFVEPAVEMYYRANGILSEGIPPPLWTTPEYYVLPLRPDNPQGVQVYSGPTLGIGADIRCEFVPSANITFSCHRDGDVSQLDCAIPEPPMTGNYSITVQDPCWFNRSSNPEPVSPSNAVYSSFNTSIASFLLSNNCSNTFFTLWVDWSGPPNPIAPVMLKCISSEKIIELNATVDLEQQTLVTADIRPLEPEEISAMYPANAPVKSRLISTFLRVMYAGISSDDGSEAHGLEWFDYLMATVTPSIVRTNKSGTPNTTDLITTFEDIYRRLFAINLELYAKDIFEMGGIHKVSGTSMGWRNKVRMSRPMFFISSAILLYTIATIGVLFLLNRAQMFLGHVPQNLAGTYALIYASNAKEECGRTAGIGPGERVQGLVKRGGRYSYGMFEGDDGRMHFGVYREKEMEQLE